MRRQAHCMISRPILIDLIEISACLYFSERSFKPRTALPQCRAMLVDALMIERSDTGSIAAVELRAQSQSHSDGSCDMDLVKCSLRYAVPEVADAKDPSSP